MRKWIQKSVFLGMATVLGFGSTLMAQNREFTLINIKYEGKVIWLPSVLVMKKGDHVKLTLINNVKDDPAVHGYSIPQFKVAAEVQRGVPSVVEFDATEAGLFDTDCQLHPAHLHGQVLVLE